jgi:SAM-dependent methyltransferase/uncharacterized protein YbaR (Trm112 family)
MLVCPRDHLQLKESRDLLVCAGGHSYPVVDGIPVLLLREAPTTGEIDVETLNQIDGKEESYFSASELRPDNSEIDSFVQSALVNTNGNLYFPTLGKLKRYPIPDLRLPPGSEGLFLDIGCNWGRWSIAAARKGYRVIGIDPWLEALRAARRIARQLDLPIDYVAADARFLPFRDDTFATLFSYSVLQHFDRSSFRSSLEEMRRVLAPGGTCLVQAANRYGLRSLYQQFRRGWRGARSFEVRYRPPEELCKDFRETIGPALLSVDGYFGLNMQPADMDLLPRRYKFLVRLSEAIRKMSLRAPFLIRAADSLYVQATRPLV